MTECVLYRQIDDQRRGGGELLPVVLCGVPCQARLEARRLDRARQGLEGGVGARLPQDGPPHVCAVGEEQQRRGAREAARGVEVLVEEQRAAARRRVVEEHRAGELQAGGGAQVGGAAVHRRVAAEQAGREGPRGGARHGQRGARERPVEGQLRVGEREGGRLRAEHGPAAACRRVAVHPQCQFRLIIKQTIR